MPVAIVENAIEHGISVQCDKSTITIRTDVQDSQLRLRVSDSGPGFKGHRPTAGSANGNGIGLANTRRRLDQLYGTRHTIEYGPSPRGGASVAIHIPLKLAPQAYKRPA